MPEDWPLYKQRKKFDLTILSRHMIVTGKLSTAPTDLPNHVNNVDAFASLLKQNNRMANFMIFNFGTTEECQYNPRHFNNQVCNFCTSKYLMPSVDDLVAASKAMGGWLSLNDNNVVVVNCRNGLARSGLVIACFLKFWGLFEATYDAFEYFVDRRSKDVSDREWINGTLKRYLRYFNDTITLQGMYPRQTLMSLHQVMVNSVPNFDGAGSCNPELEVFQNGQLVFSSIVKKKEIGTTRPHKDVDLIEHDVQKPYESAVMYMDRFIIVFWIDGLDVSGDLVIRIFHRSDDSFSGNTICSFAFNASFTTNDVIHADLKDLSVPSLMIPPPGLGKKHKRFADDFGIDVISSPAGNSVAKSTDVTKTIESCLSALSDRHYVQPDDFCLKALVLSSSEDNVKKLALQLFDNDIHLAHEFIKLNHTTSVEVTKSDNVTEQHKQEICEASIANYPRCPGELAPVEKLQEKLHSAETRSIQATVSSVSIDTSKKAAPLFVPPPPPPPPPPAPKNHIDRNISDDMGRLRIKSGFNIEDISSVSGTVWEDAIEPVYFDTAVFEKLFCVDPKKEVMPVLKRHGSQNKSTNTSQKSSCPALIDVRRANNVGIGLARFTRRFKVSEIRQKIIDRSSELNLDDLLTLREIVPTEEESAMLSIFEGLPESLSQSEFFLYEMNREPALHWMIDTTILMHTLESEICQSIEILTSATSVLERLQESPSVKRLMRAVLDLGNMVSYQYGRSRKRSKVKGFKLNTLLSLKSVYSIDREMNLLDFLVHSLKDDHPECMLIAEEFPEFEALSSFDSKMVIDHLKSIQSKVDQVKYSRGVKPSHSVTKFKNEILEFIANSEQLMSDANITVDKYTRSFTHATTYFGADGQSIKSNEFFRIFFEFSCSLQDTLKNVSNNNVDLSIRNSLSSRSSLSSLTD